MRLLVKRGAAVNATDGEGSTAAHCAASMDQTAALTELILAGADVTATNKRGQTPAHVAAFAGHTTRIIQILYKAGGV